jgi:TonB family protein
MSRTLQAASLAVLLTVALSASAQHNALKITSQPRNAQVYLDDAPKGTTSPDEGKLDLENLPAGSHKLRISAPGYQDWTQTVRIADGSDLSVEAKLLLTVHRVGDGVSAPRIVFQPDPEYSEEARQAKYQGTVVLYVEVGADGRTHNIRIQRALGLGLDEKAIEAVRQWQFEPARKDGQPVRVGVNIEINFCLYEGSCSGGPLRLKFIENALKAGIPATPRAPDYAAVTVRGTIVAVVLVTLYLVFFFLSFETKIRTLFTSEPLEPADESPQEAGESAPAHPWLALLGTVFFVAIGIDVVKTEMFDLWGALVYGPSVRAGGVVMILMGISCSYPTIEYWCRRAFKRLKQR